MGKRKDTEKSDWQLSLSYLPQVGQLIQHQQVEAILTEWPRPLVLKALREGVATLRHRVMKQGQVLASKEQAAGEIRRPVFVTRRADGRC